MATVLTADEAVPNYAAAIARIITPIGGTNADGTDGMNTLTKLMA